MILSVVRPIVRAVTRSVLLADEGDNLRLDLVFTNSSLTLNKGTGPVTLSRAGSTQWVQDHEGVLRPVYGDAPGISGSRIETNLNPYSENLTIGGWVGAGGATIDSSTVATLPTGSNINKTITSVGPPTGNSYIFSAKLSGNGTTKLRIRDNFNGSQWIADQIITLTSTPQRFFVAVDVPSNAIGHGLRMFIFRDAGMTADSVTVHNAMLANSTGQTIQRPGDYVENLTASPVTECFDTTNANTAADGVVTEITGVPLATTAGLRIDPTVTNLVTCYNVIPGTTFGSERLTNGGFDTDTIWVKGLNVTIAGGKMNAAAGAINAYYPGVGTVGVIYRITYTVTAVTSGSVRVQCGSTFGTPRSAPGTYTDDLMYSGTSSQCFFSFSAGNFVGSIDNVSMREVVFSAGTKVIYNLGPELLTNGDASNTTSTDSSVAPLAGWANIGTHNATNKVTISGGAFRLISDGSYLPIQQGGLVAGVEYGYSIEITSVASGAIKLVDASTGTTIASFSSPGTYAGTVILKGTGVQIGRSASPTDISFDNISIKRRWTQSISGVELASTDTTATCEITDYTTSLPAALKRLCSSGKVYTLVAGAGGPASAILGGAMGVTAGLSISVWVAGGTGNITTGGTTITTFGAAATMRRVKKEYYNGSSSADQMVITADAGQTVHWIVPQAEVYPSSTGETVTSGATATRTGVSFSVPGNVNNLPLNDFSFYCEFQIPQGSIPSSSQSLFYTELVDEAVHIYTTSTVMSFRKRTGGVNYAVTKGGLSYTPGVTYKVIGVCSSVDGIKMFIGGVKGSTVNNTTPLGSLLATKKLGSPSSNDLCILKKCRIYGKALSDAKCVQLTS